MVYVNKLVKKPKEDKPKTAKEPAKEPAKKKSK